MFCDICAKNPATVHLTEIIDDQMNELHLCEECAHQKSLQMEQQFGLSDLLGGLAEFEKPTKEKEAALTIKCANCGLTYADFKKIGRLGCSECYDTFKKYLGPLLKKVHGSIATSSAATNATSLLKSFLTSKKVKTIVTKEATNDGNRTEN